MTGAAVAAVARAAVAAAFVARAAVDQGITATALARAPWSGAIAIMATIATIIPWTVGFFVHPAAAFFCALVLFFGAELQEGLTESAGGGEHSIEQFAMALKWQ